MRNDIPVLTHLVHIVYVQRMRKRIDIQFRPKVLATTDKVSQTSP